MGKPLRKFKVAEYNYLCGNKIIITIISKYDEELGEWINTKQEIRDANGDFPICPIEKKRAPHPEEEDCNDSIPGYVSLGLYYNYKMPGWE